MSMGSQEENPASWGGECGIVSHHRGPSDFWFDSAVTELPQKRGKNNSVNTMARHRPAQKRTTLEGAVVRCCRHERSPCVLGADLLILLGQEGLKQDSSGAARSSQNVPSVAWATSHFPVTTLKKSKEMKKPPVKLISKIPI